MDVQAEAEKANLVSNYNIFLDGASGTGKSFTTSSLLYNMYSYGEHVFIIDIGGSYEQVCAVVAEDATASTTVGTEPTRSRSVRSSHSVAGLRTMEW